ncbi:MAG: aldo/keto reductase [Thermoproteota archaeon]
MRSKRYGHLSIHWPNLLVLTNKTMETLEKLLNSGKIRAIGVSNFNLRRLSSARKDLEKRYN